MNTAALKAFAPAVRRQLMEAVTRKLDFVLAAQTPDYLATFAPQVRALRELATADRSGLIERVAYTWFNRLTALRYLDARGWHPFRTKVLTPAGAGETLPEILKLARNGMLPADLKAHTDMARLDSLLDGHLPSSDPHGEVYRHLILAACRFYHALIPRLFERLDDETELLLPDDLLTIQSVANGFRTEITDDDCSEVEVIGWLYQFYISDKKDTVMARKNAVPSEDIPAVTQLFTPHWIVRYLVENSLGRLWLLNHPESLLRARMPYYIEGDPESDFLPIDRPQDIRFCDPAVGSGHMLTYAFDLLYVIYEEEGYAPSEIPALILSHNLHGMDICPRAAQLAELALVFKAREKSSRFFQPDNLIQPQILALQNVQFAENELHGYVEALGLGDLFDASMLKFLHQFKEASTFGSLIQPCLDDQQIAFARGFIELRDLGDHLFLHETHQKVLRALDQGRLLAQQYHVIAANPPYLGGKQMGDELRGFASKYYRDSKSDLFSMFIERCMLFAFRSAYTAMVTMQSWMFLSSYARLRMKVISEKKIVTMAHLGPRAFDSIAGEVVQATAFVIQNVTSPQFVGSYLRLIDGRDEAEKASKAREAALNSHASWIFRVPAISFREIPESPFAYWVSKSFRQSFSSNPRFEEFAKPRVGMNTTDNQQFLRRWHEVSFGSVGLGFRSGEEAAQSNRKWFPYNKGGTFRRWYGNNEFVVNWQANGRDIKACIAADPKKQVGGRINSSEFYFRPSITWTFVGADAFAARRCEAGFVFDVAGSSVFPTDELRNIILAFLSSNVVYGFLKAMNPTVNFQAGNVANLPLKTHRESPALAQCADCAEAAVGLSQADWDNFETSWEFRDQPMLRPGLKAATLDGSWRNWEAQCTNAIIRMQELEVENNRLFIDAYGLTDELAPEVPEEQITLARADARRDVAALLSYAVGCMMGRYSLDRPGLILADAGGTIADYLAKTGETIEQLTFVADQDGIIPVLDGEWFENDIVGQTRKFLKATFGEVALQSNVRFIEDSLGKELRKYFVTDFYRDHLQTYKKRPIYWLIQSPRKSFSVLVYVHRYTRDTINIILNKYLREFQVKLRSQIVHLTGVQASESISVRDKTAARKEADKLLKALHDCEEWERETMLPLAQARIELDLDHGVKSNYLKLGEALAPIPGLAAAEE